MLAAGASQVHHETRMDLIYKNSEIFKKRKGFKAFLEYKGVKKRVSFILRRIEYERVRGIY